MAQPIRAQMPRSFQPLPVNDANRPAVRRETGGIQAGPRQTTNAGFRPLPPARGPDLAPTREPAPARRMAQPPAGPAVRAPEPPPIPQRLADIMRQEAGRAGMASAGRPAVPGSGDSRGSERTDRVVPEPGAARPVGAAERGGTFRVEPQAANVAFTTGAGRAETAPTAALADQVRQAGAAQNLQAAARTRQPAMDGGVGMAKRARVVIDQQV